MNNAVWNASATSTYERRRVCPRKLACGGCQSREEMRRTHLEKIVKYVQKLQNTKFYNAEGKSKKEAEQNAALLCLNDNMI